MQSWPTCDPAMNRLSLPMRVTSWSLVVPRNAARLQPGRQPQVELLGIDADVHVWRIREQAIHQHPANPEQARQMRNDFEQPHHREALDPLPGLATFGDHPGTGNAGESCVRETLLQRVNELRTEVVAGGLAGDQDDERRRSG